MLNKNGLPQAIQFSFDGKKYKYKSNAEAGRAHGIKPGTLSLRLKKGWSIEQALGLIPPPINANTKKPVTINGDQFKSITEAITHYGLTKSLVYSRLGKGWTIEQALGVDEPPPEKKRKGKSVQLNINTQTLAFPSITAAAKYFNLDSKLVLQRIRSYQWTVEQALGLDNPPLDAGIPKVTTIRKDGKIHSYKSLKEATKHFDFPYDLVKQRINRLGWTIEQAFELEPPPKHDLGIIGHIYKVTNTQNNKIYIGQTKTTVETRWAQHIKAAKKVKKLQSQDLHSAIKKYSPSSFIIEILGSFKTIDELNKAERMFIRQYSSTQQNIGYNRAIGGSGNTGGKKTKVGNKTYKSFF